MKCYENASGGKSLCSMLTDKHDETNSRCFAVFCADVPQKTALHPIKWQNRGAN
jgi:hypothetical protein